MENYARLLGQRGCAVAVAAPGVPSYVDLDEFPVFRYASVAIPGWHPYRGGAPDLDPLFRYRLWDWLGEHVGADAVQPWTVPETSAESRRRSLRATIKPIRRIIGTTRSAVSPLGSRGIDRDRAPTVVIHAHAPFSSGVLARRIRSRLRRAGVPAVLVATLHTKFHLDLQRNLPDTVVKQIIRVIRRHFDSADQVWVPNAGTAETLRSYGFAGAIDVVPNGSDLDPPDNAELPRRAAAGRERIARAFEEPIAKKGPALFLFVGRLNRTKNIDVTLDALARLRSRDDWRLVIVGEGPDRDRFEKAIRRNGIERSVRFLGAEYDRTRLGDLYAASDLFLFPSVYDNDPLVVKEAAAFRTPALLAAGSHAAGGTRDGRNSFHAEPDDESIARLIEQLLDDRRAGGSLLDAAGRAAASEVFRSWNRVVDDVEDRYRSFARPRGQHTES